ncbi:MAG: proton-conducting transporter membrane subunit, partial [Lamprobacter sp.]|uniref:complex I subunit 5 family protein n=1 Tax=Lamprobacter sp. TaxID=3100796 RepID=UPI002B264294
GANRMTPWLLLLAWGWPLLLAWPTAFQGGRWQSAARVSCHSAPLGTHPGTHMGTHMGNRPATVRWRWILPMLGPLPALVAALTLSVGTRLELPWLFLGTALGLDATAQVYLLFTAILWLAAGIYAAFAFRGTPNAGRFHAVFLLTMAGNFWLIVGQDLFSFYAGFAMMGLAAYGLVVHDGSPLALRAGKVYLVMALLGEVSLFAALVMIAQQTGTTEPSPEDLTQLTGLPIALALVGLGVKAGLVPLHLWLPLAHPAAPVPASAVLSGAMIKVAILGWLRFLPVGAIALPEWGGLLAAGGVLTLFYALPIGVVQSDPKAILAYSSISKMGLLMLCLGLVLMEPGLAPVGVAAISLYAAQHGLAKGGLFLGVGLRKQAPGQPGFIQPLVLGGLFILALALAGAPFTSGAVAKYALKPVLAGAEWPWVAAAVTVATLGTTLLMARFIWVMSRGSKHHPQPGLLWPGIAWSLLLALVILFPFALGKPASWLSDWLTVMLGIGLAGLIAIGAWRHPAWLSPVIGLIPAGDLLVLARPVGRLAVAFWQRLWRPTSALQDRISQAAIGGFERVLRRSEVDREATLRHWPVAGGLWIGIIAMMLLALFAQSPGSSASEANAESDDRPSRPDLGPQPASKPSA